MTEKEALLKVSTYLHQTPQFKCPFTHTVCIKECWAFSEAFVMKGANGFKVSEPHCRLKKIAEASQLWILRNAIEDLEKLKPLTMKKGETNESSGTDKQTT